MFDYAFHTTRRLPGIAVRPESIKDHRDNRTTWRLANWGAFIRAEWQDGPHLDPKNSTWMGQIVDEHSGNLPDPPAYIDAEDGERTQYAMIRFMIYDTGAANVLIRHYRDMLRVRGLRKSRNLFWRWL